MLSETMYKKIVDIFFNEIKNDGLLKLSKDFYDNVREYINQIQDETELKRVKYYLRELRKLRLYKAFYQKDRENLLEEELNILKLVENIDRVFDVGNAGITGDPSYNDQNDEIQTDHSYELENTASCQKPKPINTQSDIDIVRVITKFPGFTDGKFNYVLNKNDIISLNKKISKILEKHRVVKKVNVHENEKENKKVLSLL